MDGERHGHGVFIGADKCVCYDACTVARFTAWSFCVPPPVSPVFEPAKKPHLVQVQVPRGGYDSDDITKVGGGGVC